MSLCLIVFHCQKYGQMYDIWLTRQAQKDAVKVERAGLKPKVSEIIKTVRDNPYEESQEFEKLKGDLKGAFSRRINRQHRFVYEVLPSDKIVKIISMWTHYE